MGMGSEKYNFTAKDKKEETLQAEMKCLTDWD